MSTIPRLCRVLTGRYQKPIGIVCSLAMLMTIADRRPVFAQDASGPAPIQKVKSQPEDDRTFDGIKVTASRMTVELIERFSKDLEFNEWVKEAYGFDDTIISVEPTSHSTLRVRGLKQGVTTIAITGRSDQKYVIEIFVGGDARLLQAVLKQNFPGSTIECRALMGGVMLLTGFVTDNQTINQVMDVARVYAPEVINQMRVGGPQEVQTRVKVLEVQRSKLRTFGVNLQALTKSAVIASTPGSITPITSLINPIGGNPIAGQQPTSTNPLSLTMGFSGNQFAFDFFMQALREEGLLKVMSEPVLVARSGEAARLSDGGEFPIPVPGGLGTVTIEFREFGVILQALPIVISPTRVKLQVTAEVSDKDVSNSITLQGTTVPGLTKRKVESTVDMNFGDTMVIGGLISTRETGTNLKTSLLGEIPGLGALFSKKMNQYSEVELVILLTPEFGTSMPTDQIPPGGPGLMTTTPTDRELILDGLIEVPKYQSACEPGFSNQYFNGGAQDGYGDPTMPAVRPQPVMGNPSSGAGSGLITPTPTPPSPSELPDNRVSKRPTGSPWPAQRKTNSGSRNQESEDTAGRSAVVPAGFKKGSKPKQTSQNRTTSRKDFDEDK